MSRYRYFTPLREVDISSLLPFMRPTPREISGPVQLGFVVPSKTVAGLFLEEIVQHGLLFGRTGSGKTNLLRVIQIGLHMLGTPFLAFDLAKTNTRYLKGYIDDLLIIRWFREFSFNPLAPPPGVRVQDWMLTFCEITSEVFGLMAASKSELIEVVNELYEAFGERSPTTHDLNWLLRKRRKKTKSRVDIDYIDRILNKIKAICTVLGDQLSVEQGIPIDQLLHHNVAMEFTGLTAEIGAWLTSLICAWIVSYRAANAQMGELRHVIFFDEAAKIFGRVQGTSFNEPYLLQMVRRIREFGEALVMADQSVTSLNEIVKSNVYFVIAFGQSSPKDKDEAKKILGLTREQAQLLDKMDPGIAIMKLAGRYPHPIMIQVPFVEPVYMNDEEIDEINHG